MKRRLVRSIVLALAHQILAVIGVPVLCAFSLHMISPLFSYLFPAWQIFTGDALLVVPLFPLQTLAGFGTGFILATKQNEFGKHVSAMFVWIIPTIWFAILLLAWTPHSVFVESRWQHFIWSNEYASKKNQLGTTLPFMTSVAYAVGSLVGSKFSRPNETKSASELHENN